MVKCWIHGPIDDEEKSPKPLKTHPGFPENNSYQQNLNLILTAPKAKEPHILPYRHWEFALFRNKNKELEEEQKNLLTEIKQWEINYQFIEQRELKKDEEIEFLKKELEEKNAKIERLKTKKTTLRIEKTELQKEITQKNDRFLQLEKLFKGTAKIFSKQHNYVDQLKEKLEQEKTQKGISEEQVKHLEKDVELLTNWKNELAEKIDKLEETSEESRKERDQELQETREKVNNLTTQLNEIMEVDNQVLNILGKHSDKTGLLLRSQEVIEKLNKELFWWDKWFEDEEVFCKAERDRGQQNHLIYQSKDIASKKNFFSNKIKEKKLFFINDIKFIVRVNRRNFEVTWGLDIPTVTNTAKEEKRTQAWYEFQVIKRALQIISEYYKELG